MLPDFSPNSRAASIIEAYGIHASAPSSRPSTGFDCFGAFDPGAVACWEAPTPTPVDTRYHPFTFPSCQCNDAPDVTAHLGTGPSNLQVVYANIIYIGGLSQV